MEGNLFFLREITNVEEAGLAEEETTIGEESGLAKEETS